jgi:MFS family permease
LNALSFVGIIMALVWWKPVIAEKDGLPAEHVTGAMIAGVRFAFNSNALRATLVRAAAFFLFASALWAMLPLVARTVLGGGASVYGTMLTAVGAGAVLGAFILPSIKARIGADQTVAGGTACTALVLVTMAATTVEWVVVLAAGLAGLSWIAVVSSMNVSAQTALPEWVRARGLSIYLTVFFGAMSLGSLIWGQVAALSDIPTALIAAAIGALLAAGSSWRAKLVTGEGIDHTPSMHWPEPILDAAGDPDGPVRIQIEYYVERGNASRFRALMVELARSRRKLGAFGWQLMQDAADQRRFIESWMEGSWLDHQRHHRRVTEDDKRLQAEIADLQVEGFRLKATHLITANACR